MGHARTMTYLHVHPKMPNLTPRELHVTSQLSLDSTQ